MHDPRDYPLPDPEKTPWLTNAIRILAIGVTTDRSVIRPDDEKADDIDKDGGEE